VSKIRAHRGRGLFPNIALAWLRFFKPSFHPWDHDNRAHLARIGALVAEVEAAGGGQAPSKSARHR
jgi:predicted metal-dependent hydrolase